MAWRSSRRAAAVGRARLSVLPPQGLTPAQVSTIPAPLWAAFGTHFLLELDAQIVAYASVAERKLEVGSRQLRTGYVGAVATAVPHQRRGLGSLLMTAVNAYIREGFELGALGTGRHHFYERLGWIIWKGPTLVRAPEGPRRTADEDGYVLVLFTPASPELDPGPPISCDWRSGDAW